jgi:hypothetical protein
MKQMFVAVLTLSLSAIACAGPPTSPPQKTQPTVAEARRPRDPSVLMTHHMAWDPEFLIGEGSALRSQLLTPSGLRVRRVREMMREVWAGRPEVFLNHMGAEAHFRWHVELALEDWEPLFLAYPDRFMLGTDFDYTEPCRIPWHCDERVMRLWLRFYRSILGRLPLQVAKRIAYDNAERIYGSRSR